MNSVQVMRGVAPSISERLWQRWDMPLMAALSLIAFFGGIVGLTVWLMAGDPDAAANAEALAANPTFVIGSLFFSGIALTVAVWAGMRWRARRWEDIGVGGITRRWLLIAVLAAVGLRIAVIPLALLLQALGLPMDKPQLALFLPENLSWPVMLALLALGGLVIPFAEELFFRGVLHTWLRERWGVWVAVAVGSTVFGIVHGHLTIGIMAAFLGVVLALLYERSRSLTVCFVVHAVYNTLAIGLLYLLTAFGVQIPGL